MTRGGAAIMAAVWSPRLDVEAPACASGGGGSGGGGGGGVLVSDFPSVMKRQRSLLLSPPPFFSCLVVCVSFLSVSFPPVSFFVCPSSSFSSPRFCRPVLFSSCFFYLVLLFLSAQAQDELAERDAKIAEVCVYACMYRGALLRGRLPPATLVHNEVI